MQTGAKSSKKTVPVCESSSSWCNFYHPDHPNVTVASRKNKTAHFENENAISSNETNDIRQDNKAEVILEDKSSGMKEMPKNCIDLQVFGQTERLLFSSNK